MKGAVFTGARTLVLTDFADPEPGPDEVVIEVRASGVCGSDLKTYRSEAGSPFIMGHEPCGVVVARGACVDARAAPEGARVMVHHYDGCRHCPQCLGGWTQLCDEGAVVFGRTGHGSHARFMKVPARTVVPLPDPLSFTEGAVISCGTGTAYSALRRMNLPGGETLAVIGQGPVGLSATMLAAAMGARVVAVDVSASRLARAPEFGAAETVDASSVDVAERVREISGGGAPFVLECSGSPQASLSAVHSARTWGTVGFVGMGAHAKFDMTEDIIRRQLTLVGSWTFSHAGQRECAEFCASRSLPVEALFTHHFTLEQAAEAYRMFDAGGIGKCVIHPS